MKPSPIKFIHVFDDEKFVNHAITIFESVIKDESEYFVISNNSSADFIYVNHDAVKPLQLKADSDFIDFKDYIEANTSKKTVLLVHLLSERKQNIINLLDYKTLIVWLSWGTDLYNAWKPLKYKIFEPKTSKFLYRNFSLTSRVTNTLFFKYNLYKYFKSQSKIFDSLYYKTIQKIDIVAPVLKNEMSYFKTINNKLQYAPFTYGNLDLFLGDLKNEKATKSKNILVGNSSTPANNHIEVFEKLSKLNLEGIKVFVPLSYGDKGDYLNYVLKNGKRLLGNSFCPITNFMPLEEYNKILLSCGIGIFNHIRQQAIGNIIAMSYFGTQIFLNSKGVAYDYYKQEGLKVFKLENLSQSQIQNDTNETDFKNNQKVLNGLYSETSVKKKVESLRQIIIKHPKLNG